MFKGLKAKFVAYSIALVLASILPVSLIVGILINKSVYSAHLQNVAETALSVKSVLDITYGNLDQNLDMLATHPLVKQSDASITSYINQTDIGTMTPSQNGGIEQQIYEMFEQFAENHPGTLYVYMGTQNGGYICWPETPSPDRYDPRKREWYIKGAAGDGNVVRTAPYVDSVTGSMLVSNSRKFTNLNGEEYGVIALDMTSDKLTEIVGSISVGDTGYVMMIHRAGLVLVDPHNPDNNNQFLEDIDIPGIEDVLSETTRTFDTTIDSTRYLANSFQFDNSDWIAVIFIEKSELSSIAHKTQGLVAIIAACILLAVILLTVFCSNIIKKLVGRIVDGLSSGAAEVASSSQEISKASESLANGATEQASSIEEGSASLQEIASMSKQNSKNASVTDQLMHDATSTIQEANSSMEEMTQSMSEILQSSEDVSQIIKTIDEIAFQTNLLALNAAVEAARAGTAGAGFSVVAEEVRNLAMRSADAVDSTTELIDGMVSKVRQGSSILENTNHSFQKISASASKVGSLVGEISTASNEQAEGVEQINIAISKMSDVVQQNAAVAEESSAASNEMSAQSQSLKNYAEQLRIMVNGS